MLVRNTTEGPLGLEPGLYVPAHGSLEVPDDALAAYRRSPVVAGWIAEGALVVDEPAPAADPAPQPAKPRRGRPRKG